MQSSFPQSNTPQIRRAGVDLNGVMSVLSKHLYSTPTVALRELVQNAHDSILRRRLEQPDWQGPSRIEVIGDSASNTVRIVDTGAGLTEHEIHAYLATVGVGYTRGLRQSGHEDSGLIGMFGLGFLSAFVLARRVSVRTTSYQQPELGFCSYGTSDNRNLSVFLRGMLLDDDARDLLPSWAGFVGGVIESNRLTPTASREDLQRDDHYAAIQHALAEALIAGLGEVARQQPEAWRRVLLRHNEALLGAALCDERLFALMMDSLRVPTSQGDLPASELLSRGAVHVLLDNDSGFEEMLFRAMGVPVAHGNRYAVVPFLRRWAQAKGMRLVELGTEQGNRQLFRLDRLPERETGWLAEHLGGAEEQLVIARFSPEELPLVVVPDRDAELKRRLEDDEADKRISTAALRLARQFTRKLDNRQPSRLYVNLDNPAVQALLAAVGEERDEAAHAALLLRSFKVIIAGQGRGQPATSLNQALAGLADSVKRLLGQ